MRKKLPVETPETRAAQAIEDLRAATGDIVQKAANRLMVMTAIIACAVAVVVSTIFMIAGSFQ